MKGGRLIFNLFGFNETHLKRHFKQSNKNHELYYEDIDDSKFFLTDRKVAVFLEKDTTFFKEIESAFVESDKRKWYNSHCCMTDYKSKVKDGVPIVPTNIVLDLNGKFYRIFENDFGLWAINQHLFSFFYRMHMNYVIKDNIIYLIYRERIIGYICTLALSSDSIRESLELHKKIT